MTAEEISSKVRQILQDYRRRNDYTLEDAQRDMANLMEVHAAQQSVNQLTDDEMQPTAYEWHNHETGHCYVDYVPHPDQDEKDGYIKTPLYAAQQSKMPTEEKIHEWAYNYCMMPGMPEGEPEPDMLIYSAFCDGVEWLRNQIKQK